MQKKVDPEEELNTRELKPKPRKSIIRENIPQKAEQPRIPEPSKNSMENKTPGDSEKSPEDTQTENKPGREQKAEKPKPKRKPQPKQKTKRHEEDQTHPRICYFLKPTHTVRP